MSYCLCILLLSVFQFCVFLDKLSIFFNWYRTWWTFYHFQIILKTVTFLLASEVALLLLRNILEFIFLSLVLKIINVSIFQVIYIIPYSKLVLIVTFIFIEWKIRHVISTLFNSLIYSSFKLRGCVFLRILLLRVIFCNCQWLSILQSLHLIGAYQWALVFFKFHKKSFINFLSVKKLFLEKISVFLYVFKRSF